MSARCSPGVGSKSSARARTVSSSEDDGNVSSWSSEGSDSGFGSGVGGSGVGGSTVDVQGKLLVGRKIIKRLGGGNVMSGHVKDYNPPADGKEESWILRYENPRKEESDDNSDDDEEVNRAELDKLFNLQGKPSSEKRGRGRPRKDATKSKAKVKAKTSPSRAAAAATAAAAAASPKRSAGGGGKGKKRPASPSLTPSSTSTSSPPATPPPTKKKKKKTAAGEAGRLRGDKADVGKRVAKEFTQGMFTGEVVEVKPTGARGVLWKIDYEDGDREDLNGEEMDRVIETYDMLTDKFEAAKGRAITAGDLEGEGLDVEGEDAELDLILSQSQSQGKTKKKTTPKKAKGNGKKKGLGAQEKLVGAGIRKFFIRYDEWYDGKVTKYRSPESHDEDVDLWSIKYEDGDTEDMNAEELAKARADYKERYALVRKRVTLPTNSLVGGQPATNLSKKGNQTTVYGETPIGPRGVFCTIEGYRRYKEKHGS